MKTDGHGGAIPFHRASLGEEEVRAVTEVIRSGWLTMGPETARFENDFSDYVGARHSVAVCSGTAALHLALLAAGVRAGDEVIAPTNTFTATAEAIGYIGARPVLADIDPLTMNLDPEDICAANHAKNSRGDSGASRRAALRYGCDSRGCVPPQSARDRRCGARASVDL